MNDHSSAIRKFRFAGSFIAMPQHEENISATVVGLEGALFLME